MRGAGEYVKIVNIERMTNNANPFWGGGGRRGRSRGGSSEEVGALILMHDTLYRPNTHCHKFSSRYSFRLPSYGFHKNIIRNLSKGHKSI